jgi:uncharacterized protein YjiS (DUF1127 family)
MACGNHDFVDNRVRCLEEASPARLGRGSFFRRCLVTLQLWRERARQRHALSKLDDRLLADIGLTRADAERECAQPFGRPGVDDPRDRSFPGARAIAADLLYLSGR